MGITKYLRNIKNRMSTLWIRTDVQLETCNVGGKEMDSCDVYLNIFKPKEHYVVYSAGIGDQINFELDLIEKIEKLGGYVDLYAFDPTPKSIEFLQNLKLPDSFHFYPYALTNIDKKLEFALPTAEGWISGSTVDVKDDSRMMDFVNRITVEGRSVESIAKEFGHKRIDLLKMDIEGAEFETLETLFNNKNLQINELLLDHHEYMLKKNGISSMRHLLKKIRKEFFIFQSDNGVDKNPHIGCVNKNVIQGDC